ncbi:MAG: DUF2460 domain-containing protein [Pseudomonadota bacterium]
MSFHEIRFPAAISFGSSGAVERRTEIVTLANGFEERNAPWAQARRRWDAGLGVQTLDDLDRIIQFFEARRGRLYGFRWKDWLDCRSGAPSAEIGVNDQEIGTGDGVTVAFQLSKTYASGGHEVRREIAKPVAGTVQVAVDGIALTENTDFVLDATTGRVTLTTPPAQDAVITAGFEFDVPARFDSDIIEVNLSAFEAGEIPSVPILEIRV